MALPVHVDDRCIWLELDGIGESHNETRTYYWQHCIRIVKSRGIRLATNHPRIYILYIMIYYLDSLFIIVLTPELGMLYTSPLLCLIIDGGYGLLAPTLSNNDLIPFITYIPIPISSFWRFRIHIWWSNPRQLCNIIIVRSLPMYCWRGYVLIYCW